MAINHMCLLHHVFILQAVAPDKQVKYSKVSFSSQTLTRCLQQTKKIIAFHHLQSFLTHNSCHTTVINRFSEGQMWDPTYAIKSSKSGQHLRPSEFHIYMSPMFGDVLYPNFKKPVPAQKIRICQQQAQLNMPKQTTKITCQCTNPFHHLLRATPKTTRKPFRGRR